MEADPARCVFYFDMNDEMMVSRLSKYVERVNGKVKKFFSSEVTHFVTNRNVEVTDVTNRIRVKRYDPGSLLAESRMRQYAKTLQKARDMSMNVWTLGQFISFIKGIFCRYGIKTSNKGRTENLKECLVAEKEDERKRNRGTFSISSLRWEECSEYCVFGKFFVLIEDIFGFHRPVFKEFSLDISSLPSIGFGQVPGVCPFVKTKVSESSKHSSRAVKDEKVVTKRCGFCECCLVKYSDMDEHIRLSSHRSFALCSDHYESVDIISRRVRRPLKICDTNVPIMAAFGESTEPDIPLSSSLKRFWPEERLDIGRKPSSRMEIGALRLKPL